MFNEAEMLNPYDFVYVYKAETSTDIDSLTKQYRTQWPEFTKEVCRQTEVYVRHTTRFDAFLQTLVCKKQKEVCRQTSFVNSGQYAYICICLLNRQI